jgi:hypothetical protein
VATTAAVVESAEVLAERRAKKRELLLQMSEEKKIVEEYSNENIGAHSSKEEIKQKPKDTKTKAKKNKEVKK